MAIETRTASQFEANGGEFRVLIEEDSVTGDVIAFRFENTTNWVGQFTAIRVNGRVWKDRVPIPVGSSRLVVPADFTKLDDFHYWSSLPRMSWQ